MVDITYLIAALKFSINLDFSGFCEMAVVDDGSSGFVSNAPPVTGLVVDVSALYRIDSSRVVDRVALEAVADVGARPFSLGEVRAVSVETDDAGKVCGKLPSCHW